MSGFGARFPDHVKEEQCAAVYGARALFSGYTDFIDLLPDRQQVDGAGEPGERTEEQERDVTALLDWSNKTATPLLRVWCGNVGQSSYDEFLHEADGFGMRATPNASYGYLYIRAWKLKEVASGGNSGDDTAAADTAGSGDSPEGGAADGGVPAEVRSDTSTVEIAG